MEIKELKDGKYAGACYPTGKLYKGIKAKLVERREIQYYNCNTNSSYIVIEYEFNFPELDVNNTWPINNTYFSKSRIILDKIAEDNSKDIYLTCIMHFDNIYDEEELRDFQIDRMINVKIIDDI